MLSEASSQKCASTFPSHPTPHKLLRPKALTKAVFCLEDLWVLRSLS